MQTCKAAIVLNVRVPVQHVPRTDLHFSLTLQFSNWEHVHWAQETFRYIVVSFSSYFLSLTRPIVCLVYRLSIMKGLTELSTYFYNSAVKTLPQVFWLVQRKETNVTVSTTILGKFLSVFFYLARLASVWCVNTDKRNWKLFISCYLQLDATSCAVRNGTQETWIPMDVDFWIMCCWLARLQERGPTGLCGKSQVEHFILPHSHFILNSIP